MNNDLLEKIEQLIDAIIKKSKHDSKKINRKKVSNSKTNVKIKIRNLLPDKNIMDDILKEYNDIKIINSSNILLTSETERQKNNYKKEILESFLSKIEDLYILPMNYKKYVEREG